MPFLLRRTKEEVAHELPPKMEIIERVEMTSTIRYACRHRRQGFHAHPHYQARRAAQIAPVLLRSTPSQGFRETSATAGSAELERLTEMLAELIEQNRREVNA